MAKLTVNVPIKFSEKAQKDLYETCMAYKELAEIRGAENAILRKLLDNGAERTNDGLAERGTCHMKHSRSEWYDEHTGEEGCSHCWKCTACGEKVAGGATSNGVTAGPRYCPSCGRKVVGA